MPSYLPNGFGYGMETRGAWGGSVNPTIYHVINTNNSGAGSYRAALEASGPRVALIETSGRCHLTSRLIVSNPYLTVAGQCAPDPGFIVSGFGVEVTTHDVVFQYHGILPGEFGFMEDENCSFIAYGPSYKGVCDHMTLMWGPDETAAVVTDTVEANWTFIDCLIAEGLHRPTSVPVSDSHGALVEAGVRRVAWIRCLLASNKERNPYWQDGSSLAAVNCLQYNWEESWSFFASQATTQGGNGTRGWQASILNNVQIPGPLTNPAYEAYYDGTNFGCAPGNRVYRSGTLVTNPLAATLLGEGSRGFTYDPNVSTPPPNAPLDGFSSMASADVEAYVLSHCGMRPNNRIAQLDGRVIAYTRARTFTIGTWVNHQDDVGGYPSLAENYTPFDVPANPHSYTGEYTNLEIALQAAAAALDSAAGGGGDPVDETGDATNITPETARVITGTPYTVTVDESLIEGIADGTGYASTCDSNQHRAMWWKRTTPAGEYQMSLSVNRTTAGNYNPNVSIWTGTPGILTQFRITTGEEDSDFCSTLGGSYFLIPVQPSTTYYFQVTDANNTLPLGAGLSLTLHGMPRASAPAVSILISNDGEGYPAALVSLETGEILRYVSYPSGETADWLPTGEQAVENGNDNDSVAFLDSELTVVTTVALSTLSGTFPWTLRSIKSNKDDTFFVVYTDSTAMFVQSFSAVGVPIQSWALPYPEYDAGQGGFAVSRDGSVLYLLKQSSGASIQAYDLGADSALPDFHAGFTGEVVVSIRDGFVDADGNVYFGYIKVSDNTQVLRKFDPSGTLLDTFNLIGSGIGTTSGGGVNRYTDHPDGESVVVWGYPNGGISNGATFQVRSLADGSLTSEVTGVPVNTSSDFSDEPLSISDSCPILLLPVALPDLDLVPVDDDFYTPPVIAVPVPTPTAPLTPCPPQAQTGNGGKGNAGCNTGGVNATPSYNGPWGDVPEHADPDPGETLTGKNGEGVEAWIEINHVDYPSGDVTQILRAKVPLADPSTYEGGYKTDGLMAVGNVEHAFGNEKGGFEAATVDVRLFDKDPKTFRVLADTQDFEGDEQFVKLSTDAGREAGTPPRVLMRSVIRKLELQSMREVAISAVDQVYSDFGDLGPAVPFPPFTYGDLGDGAPDMTPDTIATTIAILIGEKTDWNAKDPVTGEPRSNGMMSGVYIGKFLIDGLATPPAATGRTLAQVVALMQDLVDRDADDAEWKDVLDYNIGTTDIAKLKALGTVPDTYIRLAEVVGYADLDAVLAGGTTAAPTDNEWGIIVFGLGEWFRITELYGSDNGNGVPENTRDRTRLDIAARSGSDLLVPKYAPCPWNVFTVTNPETGRTFELTAIGVRGYLLDDHLKGDVTITANGIGLMGSNGLPIGRLMDGVQFAVENFWIAGKSAGPWVTTASTEIKWSDGTAKVNSASLAARQTQMAEALGMADGPLLEWYIDTPAPKTEWMVRFQEWTETKFGTDGPGQIRCFGLDMDADTSDFHLIQHELHAFGPVRMTFGEDRENVATAVCNYDPDESKWLGEPLTERDSVGIGRYKSREKPGDHRIENPMIGDQAVLRWLTKQRVARLGRGVKQIVVTGTREWVDHDIGAGVLFNSEDGTGSDGYVDNPCIILRRRYDVERQMVTFTLWDVRDVLIGSKFTNGLARRFFVTNNHSIAPNVTNDADLTPLVLSQ